MTCQDVVKKWENFRNDRRIETVSFKASEHQLNRIDDILRKYPNVSRSQLIYDLVGFGLSQYDLMHHELEQRPVATPFRKGR